MKRFLLFIIIIFSCEKEKIRIIPNDIKPYVFEFELQAKKRGINIDLDNINVWFVSNDEMPYAMGSSVMNRGRVEIKINERYWNFFEIYPERREALIMHELGHNPLGRGHSDNKFSLMNPSNIQSKNYKENKDKMLDELFYGGS